MLERVVQLRRPPTLSVQEGVFVPSADRATSVEIESRWDALQRENPAFFDGRLYHVLGVHRNGHGGCVLHVIDCAYRYFAVQDESFDLGVRALGLKAFTWNGDQVLVGRRSKQVAGYPGCWEFAPSGGAGVGVDPAAMILQELSEETGLGAALPPVAIALLADPIVRTWEIVYRLVASAREVRPRLLEYDELQWVQADQLPAPLSPFAMQMRELLPNPRR
jgi:8-oxo-dGTP pyrophosphatase MutT (NUDIX family)